MISRRVDLPSGGYLIIDYAEALTVIDVNTGSYTGKGKAARLEDTITRTNLEAAEEVVNQLRLRDIGGIIVIDFIDMARARNRDAVLKMLRKALDEDRTKTFVVEISPLGLVEMTRQNVTDGAREIMTKPCPTCDGEGVVKSEETIAIEFERHAARAGRRCAATDGPEAYLVRMNPKVSAYFTADGARMLHALEEETGRFFHFTGSEGLPLDHFAIVEEGARAEIEEQSVPFREGEEVHVDIVEPHMYSEDDAVAKVDGYLIEVTRRDRLRRREDARADRAGGPHGGARRARRGRRGGRGGDARSGARRASAPPSAPRGRRGRAASAARAGRADAGGRGGRDAGRRRRRGARRARGRRRSPRPTRTRPRRAGGGARRSRRRGARGRARRRRRARGPRRVRRATAPSATDVGRTTTTRYNRSLGAAAAEADGAVRVRSPMATPPKSPKPASDLTSMPEATYAVVRTGGKQYRVEEGTTFLVERLTADEGATVDLEPLLYASGDESLFGDKLGKVSVQATVLGHERGPKIRIFKFKPKRGYKRTAGHRQELTRLQVTGIKKGS